MWSVTSSVTTSGSSSCMSLAIRFAFWGAVHAALRNALGGVGSSPLNEPIAKIVDGWGSIVCGSTSKVIHSLDHILPSRRLRWVDSEMALISQHGDVAVFSGGGDTVRGWGVGCSVCGDSSNSYRQDVPGENMCSVRGVVVVKYPDY